jgi:teichuronic acid biosynthesis glycosyltransferase TuaH
MAAFEQYDFIFFTLFRTDNPYSSISLSMAKTLAKTNRVFYINHPYSWKDIWTGWRAGDVPLRQRLPDLLRGRVRYEHLDTIPNNFVAIQPPPTLPINWMPKGATYRFFQNINNRIVLRTVRLVLQKYGVKDYVYINCYDPFFAGWLPPDMGAALSIYHCIDDISQDPYTDRHGTDLENEAAKNADITFVTSTNLHRLKMPYARRIVDYFNAADVSIFSKVHTETYPRPAELEGCKGRVIGFIGNLDALRIDYPLLKKVAEAYPDDTLLLVGPVNSPEVATLGLDKMPNVVLAGSRRLNELPPLLQHMDCALIPFLCNTLTKSIYPLKINEYLAGGKAVVATSFSDDIRTFGHCIYLADDHDAFIRQVGAALAEKDAALVERRIDTANNNTWEARIEQLREVVMRAV